MKSTMAEISKYVRDVIQRFLPVQSRVKTTQQAWYLVITGDNGVSTVLPDNSVQC